MKTDSIFDRLLDIFGSHPISRILAGALIASLFMALHTLFVPPDVGQWWQWLIGGTAMGLIAGVVLTWPRAVFGTILTVLGGLIILVPANYADGRPVSMKFYLIKAGIGAAILVCGLSLFLRARIIRKRAQQGGPGYPSQGAGSPDP